MQFINRKLNSANVQAEFYRRCVENNIFCVLEYKHEKCRFDAIIVRDSRIIFIIEVKNYRRPKPDAPNTKQLQKYAVYGVPVILIRTIHDVEPAILRIRKQL